MISVANHALYAWLNAPADLHGALLTASMGLALYAIWLEPLWMVGSWLWGSGMARRIAVAGTLVVAVALLINQCLGVVVFEPRPFMLNEGHTYVTHVPDSWFPSDQCDRMVDAGRALYLGQRGWRAIGLVLAALAVGVSWARVFLGLHYPLDMAGALVVGLIAGGAGSSAALVAAQRWVPNLERPYYRWLFMAPINKGWVRGLMGECQCGCFW